MDFTAIGNEVNIAARIESQCAQCELPLLLSEAFVQKAQIAAQIYTKATLKGMRHESPLYVPNFE